MTGRFHEDTGIWIRAANVVTGQLKPALFLDRDGVIVEEKHYLCRAEDVVLIEGAGNTIAGANHRDVPVVVVTNQAGIGRGYYDWGAFEAVEEAVARELARFNAKLDAVFACGFYPEHPARKPSPGMLLAAAQMLHLDLHRSWIVGDHSNDMEAGFNAGLAGGLHLLTGHGTAQRDAAIRHEGPDLKFGWAIPLSMPRRSLKTCPAETDSAACLR